MKTAQKIKLWIAFLLVVGALGFMVTLVYIGNNKQKEASRWVLHTQDVLLTSEKALNSLLNIETSARGYIITRQQKFLEPYLRYKDSVKYYFEEFRHLTADNPAHQKSFTIIMPLAQRELNIIERVTVLRPGEMSDLELIERAMEGKAILDQVRSEFDKIQQLERNLLFVRIEENKASAQIYNYAFVSTIVLFGVLLITGFWLYFNSMDRRAMLAETKATLEETKALKSQALLLSSIESLNDIMIYSVDRNYQLLNFNSYFKNAMSQSYGTVIESGMSLKDCFGQEDSWKVFEVNLNRVFSGEGHITDEEYRALDQNYFETRYSPMLNDKNEVWGATVLTINVTDRRKAEEEVQRLASIVDSSSDAIISKSLKGIITSWNKGAEKLFGYTLREVLGKNVSVILPKDQLEDETDVLSRLWDGETIRHHDTKRKRKDGKVVDVSFAFSPVKDKSGRIVGGSGIGRDITWQKEAEESIKKINSELVEAKQVAELANRTKSQFLANMSHEIRTPLNAVVGLSHLVLKTELNEKQTDYIEKIQSSSESLLGIINDILDFSKIESGKLLLEEVSFDLEEIFQRLATVITYKANAKGLEIAFGIDHQVPNYLIGDPGRLDQVLINLCGNAVKFTDDGEVVVNVKMEAEESDRVQLKFEIKDTGIGMDELQIGKLFQPFVQADGTITRKYGGTGLGLSITKRLVTLMDGSMWVESEPGKGSRFFFTIWMKKQTHQRKIPAPSIDLRNMNVLLVDDNKSSRGILKEALESFSFQVTTMNSGIQAIHYLKNNHSRHPVKLILMDWKMPGMDGLEATRIIRQAADLAGIKIIMMCTSFGNDELYMKIKEVGYNGILIKPIRYSLLYDLIIATIENGDRKKSNRPARTPKVAVALHEGNLLLVEDNEINQQVAVELLEEFGFKVEVANSGLEAVQMMEKSGIPSKYDLVLMDLRMPVMNGFTATAEIRKMPAYKDIPIVAMTADAMTGVKEDCLAAGLNDFITKPIDPNKMLDTIEKWLGHRREQEVTYVSTHRDSEVARVGTEHLDGIDIADGLSHVGGKKKFLFDLLLKFAGNYETFGVDLTAKCGNNEWEEGNRMIHTMKGTSGNLGMVQLHTVCVKLEEDLRVNPSANVPRVMQPLLEELSKVLNSIRNNIVQVVPKTTELLPDKIIPQLFSLEKLLSDHDPEAINLLNEIGIIKGLEGQLEKIREALASYDFESAMKTLKEFKSSVG